MHLRDAMIGSDGQVYAHGRLSFPGMDEISAEATTIEVAQNEYATQFFTAARTSRDRQSGYLTSDGQGATVRLPAGVGTLIGQFLNTANTAPLSVAIDAPGAVRMAGGGVEYGASDWRLEVTADADDAAIDPGVVRIGLSAALRPHPAYSGTGSGWPADVFGSRLSLECALDPVTRALGFGSFSPTLYGDAPGEVPLQANRSTAGSVRLAATPVSANGGLFGWTDDGRLAQVSHGFFFGFCAPFREVRSSTGFVEGHDDPIWVGLRGVDFKMVRDLLTRSRQAVVELISDDIGYVKYTRDNAERSGESDRVVQAHLAFDLRDDGLRLEYTIYPREHRPLSGAFTLPWEILILPRWTGRFARGRVLEYVT